MLGMYLAFIGVNLIRETLAAHPSDLAFKLFMGIIFAIIGAGYTIWIIKRMVSSKKAEQAEQKREEAALKKMEQRRQRVLTQSRTAPMPSPAELEAGMKELKQDSKEDNTESDYEEK